MKSPHGISPMTGFGSRQVRPQSPAVYLITILTIRGLTRRTIRDLLELIPIANINWSVPLVGLPGRLDLIYY